MASRLRIEEAMTPPVRPTPEQREDARAWVEKNTGWWGVKDEEEGSASLATLLAEREASLRAGLEKAREALRAMAGWAIGDANLNAMMERKIHGTEHGEGCSLCLARRALARLDSLLGEPR
jgi:hypothetical protein